jgi:uncharacterized protein (TIGR02217 family)
MSNEVYPRLKGITYPVSKKYEWKTLRVYEHPTGACKAFISQKYPSGITFVLKYAILRDWSKDYDFGQDDLKILVGFFNEMKSGFDDFLFEDKSFNYIEDQEIGIGDGINSSFQMVANYGKGLIPIYGIPKGTPIVKVNGTQIFNFEINDYGLVELDSIPNINDVITITTYFYHRVRFYTNVIELSQFLFNASSAEIVLKTFKPSGT